MKKLTSLLEYNRFKIAIGYFLVLIIISFLAASFREDIEQTGMTVADSLITADSVAVDSSSADTLNLLTEEEQALEQRIVNFIDERGGIRFDKEILKYTLDYQELYTDTVAIIYVFVEDIYEENGKTFIKAKKVFSDLNVFLKLECDTSQISQIKSVDFFVNIAAKINSVDKILFLTKAKIAEKKESPEAYITFDSLVEGIIMQGKCLEVII